ncbi:hypothetical protein AG1IA_07206 [Rhizoctonia solani AG-1 IA]|uniref:Uncharacterized protein n=1 Tax=Thanatephorus cucumeris (strain AG1-IA) TaxID=983506 RepID=L8WLI0_THACA|nr:hypothetical protein AG1IA_07206 [Rhizoctonia solani AG-1 IA]
MCQKRRAMRLLNGLTMYWSLFIIQRRNAYFEQTFASGLVATPCEMISIAQSACVYVPTRIGSPHSQPPMPRCSNVVLSRILPVVLNEAFVWSRTWHMEYEVNKRSRDLF